MQPSTAEYPTHMRLIFSYQAYSNSSTYINCTPKIISATWGQGHNVCMYMYIKFWDRVYYRVCTAPEVGVSLWGGSTANKRYKFPYMSNAIMQIKYGDLPLWIDRHSKVNSASTTHSVYMMTPRLQTSHIFVYSCLVLSTSGAM